MTARAGRLRVPLRPVLLLPLLLLAACPDNGPVRTDFPPLTYDYLPKLKLTVADIGIDNAFAKREVADPQHVEMLAPVQPADALARMAQDRLIPAGSSGHAVFVIDDASVLRVPGGFEGVMHVRLDITTSEGAQSGFAEARASRTYTGGDTSPAATRAALYELVKLMMSDMNVEFEYQVKHKLKDYLQLGDDTAPAPPPVQTQDLNTGAPVPGTDQVPAQPEPAQPPPPEQLEPVQPLGHPEPAAEPPPPGQPQPLQPTQ